MKTVKLISPCFVLCSFVLVYNSDGMKKFNTKDLVWNHENIQVFCFSSSSSHNLGTVFRIVVFSSLHWSFPLSCLFTLLQWSIVVYLCIIFESMHSIFALPGWHHKFILKKEGVSHFGLIFQWRDGKVQVKWEGNKKLSLCNVYFIGITRPPLIRSMGQELSVYGLTGTYSIVRKAHEKIKTVQ